MDESEVAPRPRTSIFGAAREIVALEATIKAHEAEARRLTHELAGALRERDEARKAFALRDRQYRELAAQVAALS